MSAAQEIAREIRTIGIWITGLLASSIAGGILGDAIDSGMSDGYGFLGAVAGALAFTCFRLWRGDAKSMPVYDLKDGRMQ